MSVVRDVAALWRVLDENPVESCMVAARVADYGIEPNSLGGDLWTRDGVDESLCFAGANLIPLRGELIDLNAFADEAKSTARRCSSLVGRADLVLPMWQRLESAWGRPAMCVTTSRSWPSTPTPVARSTRRYARSDPRSWTPTWWPPWTCSSVRWASILASETAAGVIAAGSPASSRPGGRGPGSSTVR
ncbi:hypothetical protein I551_3298 [Mycobacterium ulcerans str. Harvey]|uniref:DUF4081 domain-containing protein n=1 Tax=Mycobacterium ulcerans str. Harvey TaxID=1299332 RepID=A0ABN0QZU6_MYCUL|nr:hypothetical protein I551_3298 [Mycobacterium ulcerans str. Harvey]